MRFFPVLLLLPLLARAEDVETIHVVPGAHLDIGFTDTPDGVKAKRIRVLDDAIDAALADPEFRWFEENGWVLDQWREAHKGDDARKETLRKLLKSGQISVGAAWCNPHAAAFADHLDLLFFHLADFEKDFGVRPVAAVLNDVPMFPQALIDACADAGVKYLLVGANCAFSPPLPRELERTPFWWASPKGNKVLVWVDDDSYTAGFTKWAVDPAGARFFVPKEFKGTDLETMEKGITTQIKGLFDPRGAAIVQHSFDNWDTGAAKRLPKAAKEWNDAKKGPRIVLGGPEAFFKDIEARCGDKLPVKRGEWGGAWDAGRAAMPVWTWRIRQAMDRLKPDAPFATRALLATCMEHSQGLGGCWPGMLTEQQTKDHNTQVAGLFRRAVEAVDPKLAEAIPLPIEMPQCAGDPEKWKETLAHPKARIRAGQGWLGPFVVNTAAAVDADSLYCMNQTVYTVHALFHRDSIKTVADQTIVIEINLRGEAKDLKLAPLDSPDAVGGQWLRGEPPGFVVAPRGIRVTGTKHPIDVTCDLVQCWTVEKGKDGTCWLQGLLARQGRQCEFKGGVAGVLDWDAIYIGEPTTLDVFIHVELAPE